MNSTIRQQLNHRTIRHFTDQKVTPDQLTNLLQVANRTASSMGAQSFSIIRLTNPQKKATLADICGQPYVKTMPELVIFIIDAYRNAKIAEEQGVNSPQKADTDRFFQGFSDGLLAAQNMTVAIESLGLGAVYLGSILNDVRRLIVLLDLPPLTFPIVGLGFGHPAESPELKPRIDLSLKVFENSYHSLPSYLTALADYDQIMHQYYDLRNTSKPLPTFSQQIVNRLEKSNPKRSQLLQIAEEQGFHFNL